MTVDELREELASLSGKMERRNKVESMLKNLQSNESDLLQQEQRLRSVLTKEEADVERLQKTTATSLLYSFLGKIVEKRSEEQQEAFAAKLKYDAAVRQLDDCKAQIEELRREMDTLAGCKQQYSRVHARLLEMLRADPAYAVQICALERQRGATDRQLKELDEAISAGNAAIEQADQVMKRLDSAEGWGTWDMLGGGMLADMAKHSHLDEAQLAAEELQVLLSRFHTELADVAVNTSFGSVNVEGFLRFADFFFDGLLADWSVQSRIHDSQQSVQQVRQQVTDALAKLAQLKNARNGEKAMIDQQVSDLVVKA